MQHITEFCLGYTLSNKISEFFMVLPLNIGSFYSFIQKPLECLLYCQVLYVCLQGTQDMRESQTGKSIAEPEVVYAQSLIEVLRKGSNFTWFVVRAKSCKQTILSRDYLKDFIRQKRKESFRLQEEVWKDLREIRK